MASEHAHEQDDQAGPVCQCKAHPQHGQDGSTVGRMANITVRAVLHHLLISRHRHIPGKEVPQCPDSVPAKGNTEEDQGYPEQKERCSMPGYRCCLKQPTEQEIQGEAAPQWSDKDAREPRSWIDASF